MNCEAQRADSSLDSSAFSGGARSDPPGLYFASNAPLPIAASDPAIL